MNKKEQNEILVFLKVILLALDVSQAALSCENIQVDGKIACCWLVFSVTVLHRNIFD